MHVAVCFTCVVPDAACSINSFAGSPGCLVCRGPPGYWFRPLWVVLYILMALSASLIYNQPQPLVGEAHKRVPLLLFTLQV